MRTRTSQTLRLLAIVLLLGVIFASGCAVLGPSSQNTAPTSGGVAQSTIDGAPSTPGSEVKADGSLAHGDGAVVSPELYAGAGATVDASKDTLVISTAGISIEVKDLDASVTAIRQLVAKYGATIANLSMSAGGVPIPTPQPLDGSSTQYTAPTPGGATVTLRIPAEKLAAAEQEIAALGRVLSQTSSQDDVTQEHVDMKARLKNLQAEESRLRTFFLKAKRVSEMLAIEQQLTRVRGEIESMQAQITYLERQAAMATLTVSLSQPGALVSPAPGGWGFSAAVRDGVRAAATVIRSLITMLIAFSPLILLGLVLFVVIRMLVVRNRKHRAAAAATRVNEYDAEAADSGQPPTEL